MEGEGYLSEMVGVRYRVLLASTVLAKLSS
jgi:hypothetical protein